MSEKVHTGWLNKKGKSVKNWKRRFFVLTDDELAYYSAAGAKHRKGTIKVASIIDVINRSPPFTSPIFDIVTSLRVYVLQAGNQSDLEEWIRKLDSVGHFSRHLAATSNVIEQGIVKQGVLNKRGQVRKNWKSRHFTLYLFPLPRLIYCAPSDPTMAKGFIDLRDITNVVHEEEQSATFLLTVNSGRTFILQAESVTDRNDWVSVINSAVEESVILGTNPRESKSISAPKKTVDLIKQGWMKKKGDVVKSWKKRYFSLVMVSSDTAELRYYASPDTTIPKGIIDISAIVQIVCEPGDSALEIVTKNRVFYCKAESELAAQEWETKIYSCQLKIKKQ